MAENTQYSFLQGVPGLEVTSTVPKETEAEMRARLFQQAETVFEALNVDQNATISQEQFEDQSVEDSEKTDEIRISEMVPPPVRMSLHDVPGGVDVTVVKQVAEENPKSEEIDWNSDLNYVVRVTAQDGDTHDVAIISQANLEVGLSKATEHDPSELERKATELEAFLQEVAAQKQSEAPTA